MPGGVVSAEHRLVFEEDPRRLVRLFRICQVHEARPDRALSILVRERARIDEVVNEDDTTVVKDGVTLLIDPMSYQYLTGAEIDYQEGLEGAQFVIKNPNAQSTCGCGSSFSV